MLPAISSGKETFAFSCTAADPSTLHAYGARDGVMDTLGELVLVTVATAVGAVEDAPEADGEAVAVGSDEGVALVV
jgi:hypothetical protein